MRRLMVMIMILAASALPVAAPAMVQADSGSDALDLLMNFAIQQPSTVGPLRGGLQMGQGMIHRQAARVSLRDFYAGVTFTNPDPESTPSWDFGISFRQGGDDEELNLIIEADGAWSLRDGTRSIVGSGQAPSVASGVDEANHIDLVAVGNEGYFAINGVYVATLDLSARESSGDIAVGVAYFAEDQQDDAFTPYDEFEIWSLDRSTPGSTAESGAEQLDAFMEEARASAAEAGPFSGEVLQLEDELDFVRANVFVRDLYAHVEFTIPYAAAEHPWDIGIGIRERGNRALRIVVTSGGEWYLSHGDDPYLVSGMGAQLNTEANGSNTLDVVARGDTGYLAVNDEYVATIDLSESEARGDVWVSSGFFIENTLAGAGTEFSDFRVWALAEEAPDTVTNELVSWGDGEVIFSLPADGSAISGLASLVASDEGTTIEVRVVGVSENALLAVFAGDCAELGTTPLFALEAFSPAMNSSVTTLDVAFEELTDGGHAIAVWSADDPANVLTCNEIPSRDIATVR